MTRRLSVPAVAIAAAALVLTACGTGTAGDPGATAPEAARAAPAAFRGDVAAPARCDDGPLAVDSFEPNGTVAKLSTDAPNVRAIRQRGRLIVGTSGDVLLWGARDPVSGQLEGFDIQVARDIAKAIFNDPNKIEFRVINYAQRLPAVSGGEAQQEGQQKSPEVDIVLHTMTINCARWEQIAFSAEYYHAGQKLMVRADDPAFVRKEVAMQIGDLADGTKICVPAGSTNEELLKAKYANLEAVPVPEIGECLVKFQRGEVTAITGDDTVLAGFAAQDPYAEIVGAALSDEPYGIGISKSQPDLVRFVNAVLDQLKQNGRWDQIYLATMGRALDQKTAPEPPPSRYGRR